MAAWTWNGTNLFGSGPHRVRLERSGRDYLPPGVGDNFNGFTLDLGPLEVRLVQTGRLVAGTESALFALADAVRAVAEGQTAGTLALPGVRTWPDVRMMRFASTGPVDRGRLVSMPYEILYIDIA